MPLIPTVGTQLTTPVLDPTAAKPRYRVQVFDATGTGYGPGSLVAEFENAKAIGCSDYMNDVGQMFWTLDQGDPDLALLDPYIGTGHVRVWRNDRIIWTGWLLDTDETESDVILYAYSYMAGLFWTVSGWNDQFLSAEVGPIVRSLWASYGPSQTNSSIGFVATGTIQSTATDSTNSSNLSLPLYQTYYKRLLLGFQELAGLSASDTGFYPVFEVTHSATPQFNFWRNPGIAQPTIRWEWGAIISGYHRYRSQVWHRNDLLAVGQAPHNVLLRDEEQDTNDQTTNKYGRRQEPLNLSWVRDQTELQRITKYRLRKATLADNSLWIGFKPNSVLPPGANGSLFRIGDQAKVVISKGITNINTNMLITGWQVELKNGAEQLTALVQTP